MITLVLVLRHSIEKRYIVHMIPYNYNYHKLLSHYYNLLMVLTTCFRIMVKVYGSYFFKCEAIFLFQGYESVRFIEKILVLLCQNSQFTICHCYLSLSKPNQSDLLISQLLNAMRALTWIFSMVPVLVQLTWFEISEISSFNRH